MGERVPKAISDTLAAEMKRQASSPCPYCMSGKHRHRNRADQWCHTIVVRCGDKRDRGEYVPAAGRRE